MAADDLGAAETRAAICKVFVTVHQSVEAAAKQMWTQLRRRTYVTPTNYLEAVRNYRALLAEKRRRVGCRGAVGGWVGWGSQGGGALWCRMRCLA